MERGPSNSKKIVVIVSDYECPFCEKLLSSEFYGVVKKNADEGKIRLAVADFPLSIHQNAKKAAVAAHCADEQGKFWPMDLYLHGKHEALGDSLLPGYAKDLGLDQEAFSHCLSSDSYDKEIDTSRDFWKGVGVTGTPTVILAHITPSGKMAGTMFPVPPSANDTQRWANK